MKTYFALIAVFGGCLVCQSVNADPPSAFGSGFDVQDFYRPFTLDEITPKKPTEVAQLQARQRMGTTKWRIVEQLPELRTQIIDRLAGHTDFQSLCHDYDRCAEALGRFREESAVVPDRVAEYEQLLAELEEDIRQALDSK